MNKYSIINYLAKGKFGDVKLALYDNNYYALKIIPIEHYEPEEVLILKDLTNVQGVVQYIEHFFTDDNAIIVTEYCPGEELFNKISIDGEYTEDFAILLFKQLCKIVKEIHKRGIVHRDLKLENIIVDNDKLTILDFGLGFYPKKNK